MIHFFFNLEKKTFEQFNRFCSEIKMTMKTKISSVMSIRLWPGRFLLITAGTRDFPGILLDVKSTALIRCWGSGVSRIPYDGSPNRTVFVEMQSSMVFLWCVQEKMEEINELKDAIESEYASLPTELHVQRLE